MKSLVFLLAIAAIFYSCSSEETPSRTDENLVQNLSVGQWRISSFLLNGVNQAAEFDGNSFVFYQSGQMEVFRGTQLLGQGNWSSSVVGGRIKLQLSFPPDSRFALLNGEWFQVHIVLNRIKIVKSEQNSTKELLLEKL
jgi:ABC-type dipeptide/oligopeptide/nickel transport system permease subunit